MQKHHPENERLKHRYLEYLKEAQRQSEASLDAVATALSRFEADTKYTAFRDFRTEQATAFKRRLAAQTNARTGAVLSKATLFATLNALRKFFIWLADQPGFKSRVSYSDADYFNLSEKDTRVAMAHRERPVPTLEQIEHVVRSMPATSDIERRNRALIALTILTGARDRAIASLKLKHVNLAENRLDQDAREVDTKFSKTITTWFFPVGEIFRTIVAEWVTYLLTEKLWSGSDPLFPSTAVVHDADRLFRVVGLAREHWASATPIRQIFKEAFTAAGLPYFNPHSFRNTLVQLAYRLDLPNEQSKAWSQNLGHKGMLVTLTSYGTVPSYRQAEILRALGRPRTSSGADPQLVRAVAEEVLRHVGTSQTSR